MRQLVIQYPDGRYHTVEATRFFGVLVNGKEEYILEYDDLTDNTRNCITILDREGNTFVKRPLASQAEYSVLAARIRFMKKKEYDLNVLPGKIGLCRDALVALKPYASPVNAIESSNKTTPVAGSGIIPSHSKSKKSLFQNRKIITIYIDIAVNHDNFPYYLDANTARTLGLSSSAGGYYHLNQLELDRIKKEFDIQYRNASLGFGPLSGLVNKPTWSGTAVAAAGSSTPPPPGGDNNSLIPPIPPAPKTNSTSVSPRDKGGNPVIPDITVYEDTAVIREEHPFYLKREDALKCSLHTDKEYYHLNKIELNVLKRYANVRIERKILAILDQKGVRQENSRVSSTVSMTLTDGEIAQLESLFDKLMDFEDYYSFFDIEDLRNAPVTQVLNDSRIVNLTMLFKKGVVCNNELAINFADFLDGFKNSLKNNSLNK